MFYITLLSFALGLVCAAALWLVWLRDRRQVFTRDVGLWLVAGVMIVPCYTLWRGDDPFTKWIGYMGVLGFYALAHTFLLVGVRRFAVERPLSNRKVAVLALGLAALYGMLLRTPYAVQALGAASTLVACSAGIYACVKLWNRSPMERAIGFLIMLGPGANVILVLGGGDPAVPAASAYSAFIRTLVSFAFVFAALNRSAAHGERMLQRFEQLSEHSLQGIMVQDNERFYYLNPAVVKMYGYETAEQMMQAGPYARAANAEEAEHAKQQVSEALKGGRRLLEAEGVRVHPDGTPVYLRFSAWPVDWDGRAVLQVLVSDETEKHRSAMELKRAEDEARRVEEEHRQSLVQLNSELERKVVDRTKDLAQSNANLAEANLRMEHALETLRATQAELVQREKLASLGRMVAGIAHELNTPIGNALTVGTTIRQHVRQLRQDVDSGQLKKSTLTDFLAVSSDGADVLESSLHKAHALISNFRQVTKDHTDEPLSRFNLSALLETMQTALQPGYENSPIALRFELPGEVQLQSYPGHIEQLVLQLIDNARQHAFVGLAGGEIVVRLELLPDGVRIRVSDNGRGIAAEIRDKVFDPFFTTRLGGNVGLGLNTAYTVASGKLGGSVQFVDLPSQGACFELSVPLTPPPPAAGPQTLH